jgi:hypothetical protein
VLVSLLVGRTKFEREIATSYVSERIGLDCCVQPLLSFPKGIGRGREGNSCDFFKVVGLSQFFVFVFSSTTQRKIRF